MAKRAESKPGPSRVRRSVTPSPVSGSSGPQKTAPENVVEHEEIARLAYSYWEARGCPGGSAQEDWLRAEQELQSRLAPANR